MRALRWIPLVAVVTSVGCAVALGPGFTVEQETVQVRLDVAPQVQLELSERLRLRNDGNRPLDQVTIALPAGARLLADHARGDAEAAPSTFFLQPPWKPGQSRQVQVRYLVQPDGFPFVLAGERWLARPQPPRGLFAHGAATAEKVRLVATGPPGWVVLAGGRVATLKTDRRPVELQMRGNDPQPSLAVGRFYSQTVRRGSWKIGFFTLQPLRRETAAAAAAQLAERLQGSEQLFGRFPYRLKLLAVVEANEPDMALPDMLVVPPGWVARAAAEPAAGWDRLVARLWFGGVLRAEPAWRAFLEKGAANFAAVHLSAARLQDGSVEQERQRWMQQYQQLAPLFVHPNQRVLSGTQRDQWEEVRGTLFFLTLEQQVGGQAIGRALGELARLEAGRSVGVAELRAALEQQTGQNLADWFDRWTSPRAR